MLSSLFNLTVILEWITFITTIFLLDRKTGIWWLFIFFMLFTICTETAGWYIIHILKKQNNHWLYNIYNIIANVFCIRIVANVSQLKSLQKKIFSAIYLFVLLAVINIIVQVYWGFNDYSEELGNIVSVIICCIFFYKVLNDNEHIDLIRNEYFWYASGLFFDSLGSTVVDLLYKTLLKIHEQTGIHVFRYTMNALNVVYYGTLIIAFVCRRKNTR